MTITLLINGGATGADQWAGSWAKQNEINFITIPAKWNKYGNVAGPIRNQEMIDLTDPELVIAFPGGRGTRDMMYKARQNHIEVWEVEKS